MPRYVANNKQTMLEECDGQKANGDGRIMTDETLPAAPPPSAFHVDLTNPKDHIVDALIKERCPGFVSHWTWPITKPVLYALLGYGKARHLADQVAVMTGRESFDHLAQQLSVDLTLHQIGKIPKTGRLVVAANHPTGLADGVAVWDALSKVRRDIVFLANADAFRVNPNFSDAIIPVEWVEAKRSPTKTRETLRLAKQAFLDEKCVVIFPSGKLAKKIDGVLIEHDWMPTVVSLARKYKAPIQPLNLRAENSWLYYALTRLSGELRDITLFNELLNKKNAPFEMTFGPLIAPERLSGDANAITTALRDYVTQKLADDPQIAFSDL